ncbi:MAG TPA: hypothetical protein DEG69_20715, partial [Flavobacteriaceae bacterium]|nr:hypothetical protein [Flavobacteriaceae bacterium]
MKFINTITKKLARKIAKFILPELKNLFQDELSYSNHNLKYKMQQIASEDTAHFVLDNIPINKAFKDRYSLLAYCCNLLKEREKDTNGAILEFGVWKGSTINHMANILPNLQFFGFDSFEGLSEPWIFNDKGAFGNIKELPMVK